MSVPLEVRSDLVDLDPYVSPQQPARYRMNTNESPYPPPEAVIAEVARELERTEFNRYPDKDAALLLGALAKHTGRGIESLSLANGSNELFLHLLMAFGGPTRKVLIFEPTYAVHSLIARITGTDVVVVPRESDFSISVGTTLKQIQDAEPELIIVCSPNNPTGNLVPRATITDLLAAAPGLVIVDEAYIEFAEPQDSVTDLLDEHPRLVITRTFSKAWRLAGTRLGYLLAHPSVVNDLRKVRLPYNLSSASQLIGASALDHATDALATVRSVVDERDTLAAGLGSLGLQVYPSAANFVLFQVANPDEVWQGLLERGVLIRNYSTTPHLRGCLRVTAGLPEETQVFLDALKEVLDG